MPSKQQQLREAQTLWSGESLGLPPREFQRRFDAIYFQTNHVRTLWQLGGAANDYLRHHVGTIEVPHELPLKLLASPQLDARIIGLKLLVRLRHPPSVIAAWVGRALSSAHELEVCGGLHELENFLDSQDSFSASEREALRRMLDNLRNTLATDNAKVVLRLLRDERLDPLA